MGVNGENMGRRWQKEIQCLELILGAPWLMLALLENRYVCYLHTKD